MAMVISSLARLFACQELASEPMVSSASVATGCKRSVFGRAVYRITYPVRQLVSSVLMVSIGWTLGAARGTWTALENRQCNPVIKSVLSITSGVCALAASLTLGIAVSATVGLVISVGKAICEPRIDELDTVLGRSISIGISNARDMLKCTPRDVT